jgi:glycosyltransferase involved in cell wall biosynthesis
MRILMVLDSEFPPDNRVEKEARSLTEKGHQVYIACFTKKQKPQEEAIEGYKVIRKPISELRHKTSVGALKFPFYFNFWRKYLNSILNDKSFDAIHIHDLPLAQIGYEMKTQFNLRFVLDLHENWPAHLKVAKHTNTFLGKILSSNKQWQKYEKNLTQKADAIITVVEEMKNRIQNLGINKNKIFVVQNYIDLSKTQEQLKPKKYDSINNFVLIYTGGVTLQRGLQLLLKGFKLALKSNNNIELWIVGDGSFMETIKNTVKDLSLNKKVKFYGRQNHKMLLDYIETADMGVIPHTRTVQTDNSSPNKLFEYMSRGLPILASDCNSVKRIINEAECGQIYKHDSPSDLADTLIKMIESKDQLEVYSENALSAVNKKYNWGNAERKLLNLYDSIK